MVELNYIQRYHIHFDMKSWRNEERKKCRNNERKLNVRWIDCGRVIRMKKVDCAVDGGNKKERKSADGIDEEFDADS